MSENEQVQDIAYKNRLFGDVLRELIYSIGEDTYSFVKVSGLNNVMISNLITHKRYPGMATLKKISPLLPEHIRTDFMTHFNNPATREWSVKELRAKGILYPYSQAGRYNKERSLTGMFTETDPDVLSTLQLQGLFKYLTADEKDVFKAHIISYITTRNTAMMSALGKRNETK